MKFNVEFQIKASEGQIYGARVVEAPTKECAIKIVLHLLEWEFGDFEIDIIHAEKAKNK